jgi:hypothetical protein
VQVRSVPSPTYAADAIAKERAEKVFAVRNNTNRVLSVPREERTDLSEIIIKEVE